MQNLTRRSVGAVMRRMSGLRLAGCLVLLTTLGGLLPAAAPDVALAASGRSGSVRTAAASAGGPFTAVWTGGPTSAEASALDDLGVGWARVTITWNAVEPSAGTFQWATLDQQMAAATGGAQRTVLATVRDAPAWAAATPCTLTSATERQHLADLMSALASRYHGVVWQLYNEEDNTSPTADAQSGLGGCFGTANGTTPTATGEQLYAQAIQAASTAVRAADPTAQVAMGGVASANYLGQGGTFDPNFVPGVLSALKQSSSLASLDYVAVHYYSSQDFLYARTGTDLVGRLAQLRQDVLTAGLTSTELKPIIADELSYTSQSGTSTSDPNTAFNQAQQAYLPKVMARAAAANVRAAFWFWTQDTAGGLGADNSYGLKDQTGAAKPSYRALRYFTSVIKRADQFVRTLDLSSLSPKLEGYEFTTVDGHQLDVVWNQSDTTSISYSVAGAISSVTDPEGNSVGFSGNTVSVGAEPRFITFTEAPLALLPQPVRMVDTRAGSGYLGAGQAIQGYTSPNCYTLAGQAGIPATASGVLLNITTTNHPGDGYVTVYPAGTSAPATSNLNFAHSEYAIANNATVKLGSGGQVCAIGTPGVQLVLDVVGYLTDMGPSGQLQLLAQPARLVDTRPGQPYLGSGQALSGYTTPNCYMLAGASGIPANASGVLVNVTTTQHPAAGYVTVYPSGGAIPGTSNLNFIPQKYATANAATVKLGPDGKVCAVGLQGTQLIIDVVGYLANTGASGPVQLLSQPARLVDTRAGSGYLGAGTPMQGYGTPICYALAGQAGIPANATGVVLNITTAQHPGDGYVTLFPAGGSLPSTSNINFAASQYAIANGATVKLGTGGQVCALGAPGVQLILDAVGYLT